MERLAQQEGAYNLFRTSIGLSQKEYARIESISKVAAMSAVVFRQYGFQTDCERLAANARWWKEFKLLEDCVLFEYVKQQMFSDRERNLSIDQAPLHQIRIASILPDIDNKAKYMTLLLDECLPRISPYNYDVLTILDTDIRFVFEQHKMTFSAPDTVVTVRGLTFSDFRSLIVKIKNQDAAIKKAVQVAGVFPRRGSDRVMLYNLAKQLAERVLANATKSNPPVSQEEMAKHDLYVRRLQHLAAGAETENQLHALKLEEFVPLVKTGFKELCARLYAYGASKGKTTECDIHGLIDDIAKRANTKVDEIRLSVLTKLVEEKVDVENVEREIEIQNQMLFLFERDARQGASRLLKHAYIASNTVETWQRIRSLTVLMRLVDPSELSSIGRSAETVLRYMKMLMLLRDFEDLRIVKSLQELDQCDKASLARSLWLSHRNDVKGLRLICKLCIDNQVMDEQLLSNVLSAIADKGDFRFGLGIFEMLGSIAFVSILDWMPRIWSRMLYGAIASWTRSCERLAEFNELMSQLVKFPYDAVYLVELVEPLRSASAHLVAAVGLAYLSFSLKEASDALKNLLEQEVTGPGLIQLLDLLLGIKQHANSDHHPLEQAILLVKQTLVPCVMNAIDQRRLFAELSASVHIDAFVKFVIAEDRIEALLLATLSAGRLPQAWKLLQMYYRSYELVREPSAITPDSTIQDEEQAPEPDELVMLRSFAATHDLGSAGNDIIANIEATLCTGKH
eukprot:jgi/Hompol1/5215/HPOL_001922-RA